MPIYNTQLVVSSSVAGNFISIPIISTTSFVVTIGSTQSSNTYKICVTPTSTIAAAPFYISTKTTTTFTVSYITGLTGTVSFDWVLFS